MYKDEGEGRREGQSVGNCTSQQENGGEEKEEEDDSGEGEGIGTGREGRVL